MRDNEIFEGAKALSDALSGPGGQIKLSRVIGRHLWWFERVRSRGMTWNQIAKVLAAAGATREDGRPFALGHLSSAVWRVQKELVEKPKQRSGIQETPQVARKTETKGGGSASQKTRSKAAIADGRPASMTRGTSGEAYWRPAISVSPGELAKAANSDVISRMRRATKMRTQGEV